MQLLYLTRSTQSLIETSEISLFLNSVKSCILLNFLLHYILVNDRSALLFISSSKIRRLIIKDELNLMQLYLLYFIDITFTHAYTRKY